MKIVKVGMIGCGLMGAGIAQVCAQAGYPTIVRDQQVALDRGMARIGQFLANDVRKGRLTEDARAATLRKLHGTRDLADLADCDLIIEAIIEDLAAKRAAFQELDALCPAHTIFASNTSSLAIIELATATHRADRFAGLHVFNPVPIMKLVEVVRSLATSDQTIATLHAFGKSLGKTVVEVRDTPGFIVNRLLVPYLLDAVRVLEQGIASREDIDAGMQLGCGHPMGPLRLLDFVGLDTTYYIANIMYDEWKEPRFAPPPLLKRMVLAGHYGRKSGKGFYDYNA